MISKQDLELLGYSSIHYYYDDVIDREKVGDDNEDLIRRLSPGQKREFLEYIEELHISFDDEVENCFYKTLKLMQ